MKKGVTAEPRLLVKWRFFTSYRGMVRRSRCRRLPFCLPHAFYATKLGATTLCGCPHERFRRKATFANEPRSSLRFQRTRRNHLQVMRNPDLYRIV